MLCENYLNNIIDEPKLHSRGDNHDDKTILLEVYAINNRRTKDLSLIVEHI